MRRSFEISRNIQGLRRDRAVLCVSFVHLHRAFVFYGTMLLNDNGVQGWEGWV